MWNSSGSSIFSRSSSYRESEVDDEEALRWAALERLPTYDRVRRGIFRHVDGDFSEIDVCSLEHQERKLVLDRLINATDSNDTERFFDRMRRRFDGVGMELPKIEVRFQQLKVDAYVHVGSRALPTIPNFIFNTTENDAAVGSSCFWEDHFALGSCRTAKTRFADIREHYIQRTQSKGICSSKDISLC